MIDDIYKKWEASNLNDDDFKYDFMDLPSFIEKLYGEMKIDIIKDLHPYKAYFGILKINNFINSILSKRPDLISMLSDWFEKEKNVIDKIAGKIGVLYFSISIGIPGGISISMTFQPHL